MVEAAAEFSFCVHEEGRELQAFLRLYGGMGQVAVKRCIYGASHIIHSADCSMETGIRPSLSIRLCQEEWKRYPKPSFSVIMVQCVSLET